MMVFKFWPLIVIIAYQLIAQTTARFEDYKDVTPIGTVIEFNEVRQQNEPPIKMNLNKNDIKTAIEFSKHVIQKLSQLEKNILGANIQINNNTIPAYGQYIDDSHITTPDQQEHILQHGKYALILSKATQYIINSKCLSRQVSPAQCLEYINNDPELSSTICESMETYPKSLRIQYQKCKNKLYRTYDGSCNNLKGTNGKALTSYKRLIPPMYSDGVQEPRRSITKRPLTNPRYISAMINDDKLVTPIDRTKTLAFTLWGQFIEHDLAHTVSRHMVSNDKPIQCCDMYDSSLSPRHIHPDCMQIDISEDDPVYSSDYVSCMRYVRSQITTNQQCKFSHVNQMNEATHFLDGSHIYGNNEQKAKTLRRFQNGLLKTSSYSTNEYLQLSNNSEIDCQQSKNGICFTSGDSRVNYHPQLTIMYTIWTREHNRIAKELKRLNPTWNDEQLYQEARRIVIAEIQHITYNEWLPLLMGPNYEFDSNKYNPNIDPSITNSFATAVLRFLNSMVDGNIQLSDESRNVIQTLKLSDYFNRPQIIVEDGYFDSIIRGFTSNKSPKSDLYFTQELTTKLFKGSYYGYDILALDIQRSRDHGLPSYNHYREACGLKRAQTFEQLKDVIHTNVVKSLQTVYQSPDDIDLLIGLLAETTNITNKGKLLGPTGLCLLQEQLKRTQIGDRYFYTNQGQPKPFSREQLKEIEKVTLARVLCDDSDKIEEMQPNVFEAIANEYPLVSCSNEKVIPRMKLSAWKS
ncbi:peroxidase-like isoform X2 [Chrysoperla carnea]|nr:peroxidase-like isoform X2 [Chrysoperla carnea]